MTTLPSLDAPAVVTLRTMLDRLIPRDEFAGATDVGVDVYVIRQLGGDLAEERAFLGAGLVALEREARAVHRRSFATLIATEQDALLDAVSRGSVQTIWPVAPTVFFNRLVELAAEGYYADPGQGGNRGEVSWRMLGYQRRVPERTSAP